MKPSFVLYLSQLYRQHSRQVLATQIRLLGDFQLAEEARQEAYTSALQQWPQQGTIWTVKMSWHSCILPG
ncbi:hypothetical protein [Lacimicrobium sp. SS2-24]|uniref:hypothetical protein n=1 Tax=Lacimicrobium sp. SS2-24 TaxID=2005569 RepID=UPI000B4B3630|nr:hypothetical protein [Lacimicrobium sp. SS2-24]